MKRPPSDLHPIALSLLPSARRWRNAALVCAVTSVGAIILALQNGAVICKGGIEHLPDSAAREWRTFEPLDHQGGFAIASRYVGKPLYGHHTDGFLYDPRLCRHSGISVDSWLSGYSMGQGSRSPEEIVIAKDPKSDVHVARAMGERTTDDQWHRELQLLAVFRPSHTMRIGWVSDRWIGTTVLAAIAVLSSILGAFAASRRVDRATKLLDPNVHVEGELDAGGTLTVDGEVIQHESKLGPGPLRVHVRLSPDETNADYRASGARKALDVTADHPVELVSAARGIARATVIATLTVFALSLLAAGCAVVVDEMSNIY